ncbi:hypothetical protein AMTR_s00110p00101080 [Amborella trichopoda]|uniref:TF-B3 domain-containing protein n=1 Tax=Amborella trichopoda TaxID=13333 RepID=W1NX66_AMBTC|nr:hypothetical protein AMTR_s00110p00101080 [Amborella trichopoda]
MEKGKGVFYSDPHVHGLNLLADVVQNVAKTLLASKIMTASVAKTLLASKLLTASALERHLNRLFLPKNQFTENVANILSAEEWDGANHHKKEIVVRTWVGGIEEDPIHFKYWNSCRTYLFGGKNWFNLTQKHAPQIGDQLNIWAHRDLVTSELLFEFTIDRKM